jgi:hypothetical protein
MAANRMARNPSTARIQNRRLGEARVSLRKTFRISKEALTWPLRGRGRSADARAGRAALDGSATFAARPHAAPSPCCAFADIRGREELAARTRLLAMIDPPVGATDGHTLNVGAAAQRPMLIGTRAWLIFLPAKRTLDPVSVASPVARTSCTP